VVKRSKVEVTMRPNVVKKLLLRDTISHKPFVGISPNLQHFSAVMDKDVPIRF